MPKLEKFVETFQLPPAMVPHVNLIVTEQEMDLVVALAERAMTVEQVAEMAGISKDEADGLLARAFLRDVINKATKDGVTTYSPSVFYKNMDFLTHYESGTWRRIPSWTREAVGKWQEQEFIKLWRPAIEKVVKDPEAWVRLKNRDVLLLEEVMELVEATEDICLLPCTCKTALMSQGPVVEGSIRLGKRARTTLERGQGRRLSVLEAKAHLITLDRAGLIHTGLKAWRKHDPGLEWMSHGNCDPSYSFPFRAGMSLGLTKEYPRAHHIARIDWDKCSGCGVCIGRCPFGAFHHDGSTISIHAGVMRRVEFDSESCWGCGLCATTCPEKAIAMDEL